MGVGGALHESRFGVLGELLVEVDGRPVSTGGPKQRALLVRLLLAAPHAVSSDRLIDDLWPDGGPPTADGTLQAYISRLRRVIGADRLHRDAGGYRLQLESEAIDLRRFQARLDDARRAVVDGRDGAAAALLDEALAQWRGEPAIEWYDLASASAELTVLDEQRTEADRMRAEVAMRLDDPSSAVVVLEPAVERQPLDEALWVLLASALDRQGRHVEAGAALDRAVRRLDAEGWEPGPFLTAAISRHRRVTGEPAGSVPFVGRADEIADVVGLLDGERLVSLVGVGGVGKSRLAGAVVDEIIGREPGRGVWRIDLAELGHRGDPVELVARTIGAAETRGTSALDAVVQRLGDRPTLLVLDTCELVVEAVAALVEAVVDQTDARVLTTSRVALGLGHETVYPVEPLAQPVGDGVEEVERSPAARLLGAAANVAFRGFRVSASNAPAMATIARRLGGLPLALRVAGAYLAVTTPQQLAARLDEGFPGWMEDAEADDARHSTLRATLDWSFETLPSRAQEVLLAASVFTGPFTVEALCQIVDGDLSLGEGRRLLRLLEARSMLESVAVDGAIRFGSHSLISSYARDRLDASHGLEGARRRHLAFLSEVIERGVAGLRGPDEMRGIALLRSWNADIDFLLERLLDEGDVATATELAADLVWWWYFDGRLRSGAERIGRIVAATSEAHRSQAALAELLAGYGMILAELTPSTTAGPDASRTAMELAVGAGDDRLVAVTTMAHADALTFAGPVLDAEPFLDEAERAFAEQDCHWGVGWARSRRLRTLPARRTSAAEGRVEVRRAAEALTTADDRRGLAYLHLIGTNIERLDGRPRDALREVRAALALFEEMQDPIQIAKALRGVVLSAVQLGEVGVATDALRRFDRLLDHHPVPLWQLWAMWGAAELALVSGRPEDAVEIGERIVAHLDRHGELPDAPSGRALHVRALLAAGRADEADAAARAQLDASRSDPGSGFVSGEAAWVAAQAALAVGDRRRFVRGCRRAVRSYTAVGARSSIREIAHALADAQAAAGRHRWAARLRASVAVRTDDCPSD